MGNSYGAHTLSRQSQVAERSLANHIGPLSLAAPHASAYLLPGGWPMRRQHIGIAVVGFLTLLAMPRQVDAQGDESQILATVQEFFDSMTAKDTAAARQILVMDATYFSVRKGNDGTTMRGSTNREYVEQLATTADDLQERMWDPQVMVHEGIAVVWAPYEFQVNGKFSHCGVDAFSLIRIGGLWKIAGIVYTVEQECGEGR